MTRFAVVSVGRSDYSLYYPILEALASASGTEFGVIVGGAHLNSSHGDTLAAIRADGFPILEEVRHLVNSDTPVATAESIGLGVSGYAVALNRIAPDVVLVLGDRYEMLAAAVAAYTIGLPLGHIHGGEVSYGALDDGYRHAITKLSHVHFAATAEHAARIRAMGEEPWRIHVTGSPAVDNFLRTAPLPLEELTAQIGLDPRGAIVMTFHPATLADDPAEGLPEALEVLSTMDRAVVITAPNSDPGNLRVREFLQEFVRRRSNSIYIDNLGRTAYPSLLRHAAAMIGNSSSGIIEAPSFGLPAVNIGTRQDGRSRGANVIDAAGTKDSIGPALDRALSAEFRASISDQPNPYGSGDAAAAIVEILQTLPDRRTLIHKKFANLNESRPT